MSIQFLKTYLQPDQYSVIGNLKAANECANSKGIDAYVKSLCFGTTAFLSCLKDIPLYVARGILKIPYGMVKFNLNEIEEGALDIIRAPFQALTLSVYILFMAVVGIAVPHKVYIKLDFLDPVRVVKARRRRSDTQNPITPSTGNGAIPQAPTSQLLSQPKVPNAPVPPPQMPPPAPPLMGPPVKKKIALTTTTETTEAKATKPKSEQPVFSFSAADIQKHREAMAKKKEEREAAAKKKKEANAVFASPSKNPKNVTNNIPATEVEQTNNFSTNLSPGIQAQLSKKISVSEEIKQLNQGISELNQKLEAMKKTNKEYVSPRKKTEEREKIRAKALIAKNPLVLKFKETHTPSPKKGKTHTSPQVTRFISKLINKAQSIPTVIPGDVTSTPIKSPQITTPPGKQTIPPTLKSPEDNW